MSDKETTHFGYQEVDKQEAEERAIAALEAVRQWRFEPGTRGGEKVQFKMGIPITLYIPRHHQFLMYFSRRAEFRRVSRPKGVLRNA